MISKIRAALFELCYAFRVGLSGAAVDIPGV